MDFKYVNPGRKGIRITGGRREDAKTRRREDAEACDGLCGMSPGIGGVAVGAAGACAGELLDHSRDDRPARGRGDKHGPRRRVAERFGVGDQTSV